MSDTSPAAVAIEGAEVSTRRGSRRLDILLRQAKVAKLVRRGFTIAEMAMLLQVSDSTIEKDIRKVKTIAQLAAAESFEAKRQEQLTRLLDHSEWLRGQFEESKTKSVQRRARHFVPGEGGAPVPKGSSIEDILDPRGDPRLVEQMTKTITSISTLLRPEEIEGSGAPSYIPPGGAIVLAVPAVALQVPGPLAAALARMPQPALPPAQAAPEEQEER